VRRCPQADNPAQQRREAGGDVQFAASGASFVGSVFVELAQALAKGVLGIVGAGAQRRWRQW
jgi:NADPH-dependent curcumin reductase CurA